MFTQQFIVTICKKIGNKLKITLKSSFLDDYTILLDVIVSLLWVACNVDTIAVALVLHGCTYYCIGLVLM